MPLLEGEEELKFLSYQNNKITKIDNLISLPNLVHLNLKRNLIIKIENLFNMSNLKVTKIF